MARPTEKTRNATDAYQSARVADGTDDIVGLGANVTVQCGVGCMARDHRLLRGPVGFQTRAPNTMRHIHDNAEVVHLVDGRAAEIVQTAVGSLAAAIAQGIAAVVGHVYHANAKLLEDVDEAQFIAYVVPLLDQAWDTAHQRIWRSDRDSSRAHTRQGCRPYPRREVRYFPASENELLHAGRTLGQKPSSQRLIVPTSLLQVFTRPARRHSKLSPSSQVGSRGTS